VSERKYILFNPGPVNVSERVRNALLRPEICHREDDFSKILWNVRSKLLNLFINNDEKYTSVIFTGSGTVALEAAISNSVSDDQTILVINNGIYGERIKDIAEVYKLKYIELKYNWTERPLVHDIEKELKKNDSISVVAMVHNETTTGLLNPIKEIGILTKKYGRRFIVDSISGLGGEEVDFKGYNISLLISTANKCLHGQPGISFILLEKDYLNEMKNFPKRNLYLNIYNSYISQEKGETLYTPAIQIFYALEEALKELEEEGVENRINRYKELSYFLRKNMNELGVRPQIPPEYMSNSVSSFYMPENRSYADMSNYLKDKGFIIFAGQGILKGKSFRIANMGNITLDDLQQFINHLKIWLKSD